MCECMGNSFLSGALIILSRRVKKESRGALWKKHPRRGAIMGSKMVYERGSGFIPS